MAKIRLTEVPEAPKGDAVYLGQAAGGQLSMPGVRYQEATNFERHIPGLMQPELSRRPYDALAGAQSDIGLAIAGAGQDLGGAITQLFQGMQESKDAADVSRANLQMRTLQASYEQEVAEKQIPVSQRLALWDSKYAPQAVEGFKAMKMSPHVAERVGPELNIFDKRTRTGIIHEANKEQIENDRLAIQNDFDAAIEAGDWEGAMDANLRLTEGRHQSHAQAQTRLADIKRVKQEWDLREDMADNPRMVLAEMEEIEQTGNSDIYPELKNPVVVARTKDAARKEINHREIDTLEVIRDAKSAGKLTRPEDVDRIAQGNLTGDKVAALKNELLHDPQYDKEAVVTMRTKVAGYDPETDDQAMSKYHTLWEEIGTTVPADIQGRLRSDLYQEATRHREGKPKDASKRLQSAIDQEITTLAKAGMFDPNGYESNKAAKDPEYLLKHRETHLEVWKKTEMYQEQMRQWLEKNPDANPEQVSRQLSALIGADLRASAAKTFAPRKMIDPPNEILPPAARDKLRKKLTPEEILRRVTPRYEFGKGMASAEGEAPGGDDIAPKSSPINDNLVSAVKGLEGFTTSAQWDFKQWSVGYGTRGKKGESLTPQQAEARLRSELTTHAGNIDDAAADVKLRLTPGQRNALISFDFNTGKGAYLIRSSKGNTAEILRRLKLYVKADGKTLPGLVNRRKAEAEMFLT